MCQTPLTPPPPPQARVGGMRSSSDNITASGVSSRLDRELEKMIGDMDREESISHLMKLRKGTVRAMGVSNTHPSPPAFWMVFLFRASIGPEC